MECWRSLGGIAEVHQIDCSCPPSPRPAKAARLCWRDWMGGKKRLGSWIHSYPKSLHTANGSDIGRPPFLDAGSHNKLTWSPPACGEATRARYFESKPGNETVCTELDGPYLSRLWESPCAVFPGSWDGLRTGVAELQELKAETGRGSKPP